MYPSDKVINHLSKDKVLNKIIKSCHLENRVQKRGIYESLVQSIVSQQLSTKAAATIFERFLNLYTKFPSPQEILDTSEEDLRKVGLSGQKAKYMKNLSDYFLNTKFKNSDWNKMENEEIVKELTSIKGIGAWTVQMMLMFNLGREDVLPIDDLIVRNGILHHYKINEESKKDTLNRINIISEKWKPYRSYVAFYLWASKDDLK
jgi:DNA-3-methyladenine glycosylase II